MGSESAGECEKRQGPEPGGQIRCEKERSTGDCRVTALAGCGEGGLSMGHYRHRHWGGARPGGGGPIQSSHPVHKPLATPSMSKAQGIGHRNG